MEIMEKNRRRRKAGHTATFVRETLIAEGVLLSSKGKKVWKGPEDVKDYEDSDDSSGPDANKAVVDFRNSRNLPPIGVFWDIENVQVPRGKSALAVVQAIRNKFFSGHREAEFMCVCDINKENPQVIQELNNAQVNVIHVAATCKNAADDKLCQAMRRFSDTHGAKATLILISRDVNFAPDLSDIRHRKGLTVILLHNHPCAEALLSCANKYHYFNELCEDIPLRPFIKPSTAQLSVLEVSNLPENRTSVVIKNRLKHLSLNCGGKVLHVNDGTALLKFSSPDIAERAQKRMNGEDVYGHKITVNFAKNVPASASPGYSASFNDSAFSSPSQNNVFSRSRIQSTPGPGRILPKRYPPGNLSESQRFWQFTSSPNSNGWHGEWVDQLGMKQWRPSPSHPANPRLNESFHGFGSTPDYSRANLSVQETPRARLFENSYLRSPETISEWRPTWNDDGKSSSSTRVFLNQTISGSSNIGIGSSRNGDIGDSGRWNSVCSNSPLSLTPTHHTRRESGGSSFCGSPRKGRHHSSGDGDQNGVELLVTNFDPHLSPQELKRLVYSLFEEHVTVQNLALQGGIDGNWSAIVGLGSMSEAQYAISQLQRIRVGSKKLQISFMHKRGSSTSPSAIRWAIQSLLSEVPGGQLQLFRFNELYERRYNHTISMAELSRHRDLISIVEDGNGRMVCLNPPYLYTSVDVMEEKTEGEEESPYCRRHHHTQLAHDGKLKGWAEQESICTPPSVRVGLKTLAPRIHSLLQTHNGKLPLASLAHCYKAEFEALEEDELGIPLEQLITCIPGVQVVQKSPSSYKQVQWMENRSPIPEDDGGEESNEPLLGQLSLFSREVMDLLKTFPRCQLQFSKFIPAYHHHFGRQCRVADYGFTKLMELFEAIPNVVLVLGEGTRRIVTLSHQAQMKRFTADILKVLRSQPSKEASISILPNIFEKVHGKPLDILEYGLCELEDALPNLSDNLLIMQHVGEDLILSIPKREQTPEELERMQQFAVEAVELLRYLPRYQLAFLKFIPAYHCHFGRQCRVADYGFSKLQELFEALPDVIEVYENCDMEKMIQLTKKERLRVVSDQVLRLVQNSAKKAILLADLPDLFLEAYGYSLDPQLFGAESLDDLLAKIRHAVKVVETRAGPLLIRVDQGPIHLLSLRVRRLLMQTLEGRMSIPEFMEAYLARYKRPCSMELVRQNLEDVVEVEGDDKTGTISLVPLQCFARDVLILLQEIGGRMPLHAFESAYLERFGVPCRPAQYGHPSISCLVHAIPDIVFMRGRGTKSTLYINRENAGSPLQVSSRKDSYSQPSMNSVTPHEESLLPLLMQVMKDENACDGGTGKESGGSELSSPSKFVIPPKVPPHWMIESRTQTGSPKAVLTYQRPPSPSELPMPQGTLTSMQNEVSQPEASEDSLPEPESRRRSRGRLAAQFPQTE